jgi:cytoskeletal protein CcmA (bactofilin family)
MSQSAICEHQERPVNNFSQSSAGREKSTSVAPIKQTKNDGVFVLGPGSLITGKVVCDGAMQIFGRVMGDTQAAEILVADEGQLQGNLTAHDVTISGSFKGTIRAHNVKLKGAAQIDGEIYSKSLIIEESVQFEGMSRRLEKPIDLQSTASTPQAPSAYDKPTEAVLWASSKSTSAP